MNKIIASLLAWNLKALLSIGILFGAALIARGAPMYAVSGNMLLRFDTASPTVISSTVPITNISAGETLVGIDFRTQNGLLYGLGVNATADTATLYAISVRTGFAGVVGTTGSIAFTTDGTTVVDFPDPATVGYGFDFNPAVDRLRVVAGSLNFRANPNTGLGVDGDNGGAVTPGTNPDGSTNITVDAAGYTNNQPNNGNITTLYTLDAASNRLFIQNPPNAGTQTLGQIVTLGGNPLDFTTINGFDIPAGVNAPASNAAVTTGSGFAALNVGGTTALYSINLVNAVATLIGNIGNGTTAVQGVAVQSDLGGFPAVSMNAAGTNLIRFNTSTPGTNTTQAITVASLAAGEQLVGIDFRPQTGQLYGLAINATANTGTVYIVDPQSGALTVVGTQGGIAFVAADGVTPVDFPDPAVSGYGIDFNPTVDRLRVVTSTGLTFRINQTNGTPVDGNLNSGTPPGVNTDGNINGSGVTGVSGAAYTNSFGQSLTGGVTTLYTLDGITNGLYIQNPPNAGTQTVPLGITVGGNQLDFTDINGFDLSPGVRVSASNAAATGVGYAVLTVAGATRLYSINLANGVTTDLGAVGAGTTALAGFTLADRFDPQPSTTTIISDNPEPSVVGQTVTVVYSVATSGGTPTGNVVVTISGGAETCTGTVAAGQCNLVLTSTGTRLITATYQGDQNSLPSSDTELHTVNQAGTTTTITGDAPDPSVTGQVVTVNYTVVANAPGAGTPTGNVVITVSGGAETCTGTVAAGTCNVTLISAGARTLTATYAGDTGFSGSTDTETHQVNQAATTITITSDAPDPSVTGQSVVVNYSVVVNAPGGGTPTGNVVVTVSGGAETCTGTVAAGTCTLAINSIGAKTLTATYSGDANFVTSSVTEAHQVNQAGTTTTITSDNPDPSSSGQAVTVNYTVVATAPAGGTPTGNVVVTVSGGAETCTGTVAAGTCTLTLTGSGLRTITATYAGDANYTGSVDTESHNVALSISGNIQQSNSPAASTPLGGVTVDLTGTSIQQTFTDASGNYSFSGLTAGGNYTVTPSGLSRTYSPANRTYPNLTTNITNANFLAFDPGQLRRGLRINNTFVESPNQASVPIILTAIGNERRLAFSINYNNAILSAPVATCGAEAPGCTIVQTNAAGAVGITITLAAAPIPGEREIVRLAFNTLAGANSNTPLLFSDSPTARLVTDVANNPLAADYTSGFVVFTGTGLEADLAPRFTGDGVYRSNDVEQSRQFVSGLQQPNAITNEFERADVAPYATRGDGRLNAADFQLSMNYVAGLVAQQTAGGPDEAIPFTPIAERAGGADKANGRAMRFVNWSPDGPSGTHGRAARAPIEKASIQIEIDATGDETVALFTLNFDASRLSNPVVTLAEGMPDGVTLTANTLKASDGKVTVMLDSATPFQNATTRVVTITFDVAKGAPIGETPITFDGSGSMSDADARSLDATYTDGSITIKGRSISGSISRIFDESSVRLFGMMGR